MLSIILSTFIFAISLVSFIDDSFRKTPNDISLFRYILQMIVVSLSLFILVESIDNLSKPEAIDVYRGKTELRIETRYVDSVLVKSDTTVVWKK